MANTAIIDQVLASGIAGEKIAGVVAAAADANGTIYESAFGRRDRKSTRLNSSH